MTCNEGILKTTEKNRDNGNNTRAHSCQINVVSVVPVVVKKIQAGRTEGRYVLENGVRGIACLMRGIAKRSQPVS